MDYDREMKLIGDTCQTCRKLRKVSQKDVADATHYSIENICKFEQGKNRNLRIFLWYCRNILNDDDVRYLIFGEYNEKQLMGNWELVKDRYGFICGYRCSICKGETHQAFTDYCPHCGIKMRGIE